MKGIMSVIEVMITGIILIMAFIHFFPQYSVRTEWDRVLLATEVMDTLNTIDNLDKTYELATCSTAFNDFMKNTFTPETSGAMIWWKETEDLEGNPEDMTVPYFTQGYKESMVDLAGCFFEDDFDDGNADGWIEQGNGNWEVLGQKYRGGRSGLQVETVSISDSNTLESMIIECEMTMFSGGGACYGSHIVFDLQDIDDYKFAGMLKATSPTCNPHCYTFGYYLNNVWHYMKNVSTTINDDEPHFIKINITDSKVTLYDDNIEIDDYTFPSIDSGKIGIGSPCSNSTFDDFIVIGEYDVYSFTLGLGYPY